MSASSTCIHTRRRTSRTNNTVAFTDAGSDVGMDRCKFRDRDFVFDRQLQQMFRQCGICNRVNTTWMQVVWYHTVDVSNSHNKNTQPQQATTTTSYLRGRCLARGSCISNKAQPCRCVFEKYGWLATTGSTHPPSIRNGIGLESRLWVLPSIDNAATPAQSTTMQIKKTSVLVVCNLYET